MRVIHMKRNEKETHCDREVYYLMWIWLSEIGKKASLNSINVVGKSYLRFDLRVIYGNFPLENVHRIENMMQLCRDVFVVKIKKLHMHT